MEQKKINVIIVDDNVEFRSIFSDYLSIHEYINIVGLGSDGIDALNLIQSEEPDLVILDILMPRLDGLAVLEKLPTLNLNKLPKVIVLSTAGQNEITQKALSLGADYYVVKPFDMYVFLQKIRKMFNSFIAKHQLVKTENTENIAKNNSSLNKQLGLEHQITDIIHEIGISPQLKGYVFIKEALYLVVNNIDTFSSLTKELYISISKKYNTTPSRVERAIENAFEVAWSNEQINIIDKLFESTATNGNTKPTTSEFITILADSLRQKNKIS